jgi:hypothetical protein
MSDPTITVTNLGEQGVEAVLGVIYPPQVALVGFGKVVARPRAVDGLLGIRPVVTLTLSGDHRATDGFIARFSTPSTSSCRNRRRYDTRRGTDGGSRCDPADRAGCAVRHARPDDKLRDTYELDSLDFLRLSSCYSRSDYPSRKRTMSGSSPSRAASTTSARALDRPLFEA